jgi:aspartyl-tRNA(Asn)/glutamyl-tRNA(Gln) amidotransferase subunit A
MVHRRLLSIEDIAPLLAAREVSSVEITKACLEVIAERDSELRAFITVLADEALTDASQADTDIAAGRHRGPLHGVPVSLKDLIDVAGVRTTAGSRVRAGAIAARDALVVTRLRRAGAVIIGKCNLHEFAFGTTGEESAFGRTRHPADPFRSPGGSSGGSAVSVVTGMAFASVGTDTGGSVRIPAAACGCVGLKPTFGELPLSGIVPLSRSLDHVGPIARTVGDTWLLYEVLRGSRPAARADGRPALTAADLHLGLPGPYFMDSLDNGVRRRFDEALERLRAAGAHIDAVRLPQASMAPAVYLAIQLPEASAHHAMALERQAQDYQPGVRQRLELGRYVLAEDYVRAQRGRDVLRCQVDVALGGRQALVLPTLPIPPPRFGDQTVLCDGRAEPVRALMLRLTQLFNLTGHPAISIPCGTTADSLPCGLQLVGRINRTDDLLAVAQACEEVLPSA